ncbi:MAG: hypothetical protein V2J16_07495 [Thermoleophilia bacterium]|jgi:hypothetical protein|nr:hypothetical protein [Thermoleophilia bacterium]
MTVHDGLDGATSDPGDGAGSPDVSPTPPPPVDRGPAPPLDHPAPPDPDAAFAAAVAAERRLSPLAVLAGRAAPVALVAGLFGVLGGPFLMGGGPSRYLVLALNVLALAAGALGLWGALRRTARLDYAVAGLIMGAAGLYFWLSYMSDPPQGST